MKLGNEDKKKLTAAVILGACALYAVYYIYSSFSTPDVPPPAPPVIVSAPARSRPTTTPATAVVGRAAGRV
jgi:hypothetical protein